MLLTDTFQFCLVRRISGRIVDSCKASAPGANILIPLAAADTTIVSSHLLSVLSPPLSSNDSTTGVTPNGRY
jgi:hypothetical protein